MPCGTEEKHHRVSWHHRWNTLVIMGDTFWPPAMTARHDARRPIFGGELREGQDEEHLKLGGRLGNGINDVIAMERLGRFAGANLDGLRRRKLVEGAVRLQEMIADTQH